MRVAAAIFQLSLFSFFAGAGFLLPVQGGSQGANQVLTALGAFVGPVLLFGLVSVAWRKFGAFARGFLLVVRPLLFAGAGWSTAAVIAVARAGARGDANWSFVAFAAGFGVALLLAHFIAVGSNFQRWTPTHRKRIDR
jgi:uncharacterized membrane protein